MPKTLPSSPRDTQDALRRYVDANEALYAALRNELERIARELARMRAEFEGRSGPRH